MKRNVLLSVIMVVASVSLVFAEGTNQAQIDATTGPGVGLVENNTGTAKIYGYGDIMPIISGTPVVEANANEIAPISVESNILNPINNFAIDMGPTSNYYAGNYSEHSINDGGPGMGVNTNVYGSSIIYGGGPGVGLNQVQNDGAPSVIYQNVDPANYAAIYNLTPAEAAALFAAGTNTDKIN